MTHVRVLLRLHRAPLVSNPLLSRASSSQVSGNVYLYGSNDGYLFDTGVRGVYTSLFYLMSNIFATETHAIPSALE